MFNLLKICNWQTVKGVESMQMNIEQAMVVGYLLIQSTTQ